MSWSQTSKASQAVLASTAALATPRPVGKGAMNSNPITTEMVIAVHQCKRKAYFLLQGEDQSPAHEYDQVVATRADVNRLEHLGHFGGHDTFSSIARSDVVCPNGVIAHGDIEALCDLLCQQKRYAPKQHAAYEPLIVVGTSSVTAEQRLAAAFAGHVVGQTRRYNPTHGFIVPFQGKSQRINLGPLHSRIVESLEWLRQQRSASADTMPPLILNEHCVRCPFRHRCGAEAEEQDNLSLLERMTRKLIQKYESRGIFTVNQLSFIYRPRRHRKKSSSPATFNIELQALALRTGKIYLERPVVFSDYSTEVYLDIEGIPDQGFDYLIGMQIKTGDVLTTHSFWADTPDNEVEIFQSFVDMVAPLGSAPIFHYGSYESKVFRRVSKQYGLDLASVEQRLVNVNEFVFGRVYFPSRSNSLKALGAVVGASWNSPVKSGLQSVAWRHLWEDSPDPRNRRELEEELIQYNQSDCEAVRLLTTELRELGNAGECRTDVDYADSPKQQSTNQGMEVHRVFERILQSAHAAYRQGKIRIGRNHRSPGSTGGKAGAPKGHPAYIRVAPKSPGRIVRVRRRLKCPKAIHKGQPLAPTNELSEHTIIDLTFTKSGCRKSITKYVGMKSRCARCCRDYLPPAISDFGGQFFGHAFRAWAVYQRVALRLPYTAITRTIEDLFSESVTEATIVNFIHRHSKYYASTERMILKRILASPFIHVDETTISIRGSNNYVWVLTNGSHVTFRLTETRETILVQELLDGYEGVVVSDFYGGYDALQSNQQKCLVHLTRDLNEDLWKNPYNREFEAFVSSVSELLTPIFNDVEKFGVRARNLRKHIGTVERFYEDNVDCESSKCDVVAKYQKRFVRYRESLFTFLDQDGIPWNNNAAERAIRHLAVQRKISGSFYQRIAVEYLRLLGIAQTCRFQNKPFLRFLVSGRKDVDSFRDRKRRRSSKQVVKQAD